MSLTVIATPAAEPVSIAELKAQAVIDHDQHDGLIAQYLLAAREFLEKETGRSLAPRTLRLVIDNAWPTLWMRCAEVRGIALPMPPLRGVSSVTYVDPAGVTQTLAPTEYQVLRAADPMEGGAIVPAYGKTWPAVRAQYEAITVTFTAGYDQGVAGLALPRPLRQAVLLMAAHLYENREPVNVGNIVNEMPLSIERLIFPFRTLVP